MELDVLRQQALEGQSKRIEEELVIVYNVQHAQVLPLPFFSREQRYKRRKSTHSALTGLSQPEQQAILKESKEG